MKTTHWRNPNTFSREVLPQTLANWLLFSGSLTQKLKELSKGHLHIAILKEGLEIGKETELTKLKRPSGTYLFCREVNICCDQDIWMYARSVISPTMNGIYKNKFRHLGEKPLGTLLFTALNGIKSHRGSFELAKIYCPSEYKFLQISESKNFLWGRRSLFSWNDHFLILTEIFFPKLIKILSTRKLPYVPLKYHNIKTVYPINALG